jgi:hypothetical protein
VHDWSNVRLLWGLHLSLHTSPRGPIAYHASSHKPSKSFCLLRNSLTGDKGDSRVKLSRDLALFGLRLFSTSPDDRWEQ